jgi:LemA protein
MTVLWATIGLLVLLALWVAFSYNRFVHQRQLLDESWSTVDTELQRRHDLVPNLVATVSGYAGHERQTLEAVTAARAHASAEQGSPGAQAEAESLLTGWLRQVFLLAEAYPDLKASTGFLDLQHQLVLTEDRLQAARRIYNRNVQDLNRRVQQVPSLVVARAFGVHEAEYFEVEPALRSAGAPGVDLARGVPPTG